MPAVQSLLQRISETDLRAWVNQISVPRHFIAEPAQNRATADWLAGMLHSFGYEVEIQGLSRNVVAFPKSPGGPAIVLGAHYDSVPSSPGADDNGSSVAAMLGCAFALAGTPHRIIFVAFNREEDGFLGSREFVEEFLPARSIQVECAHILEMIGYAGDTPGSQHLPTALPIQLPDAGNFLGLLSNAQSAEVMRRVLQLSRVYTPALPASGLTVVRGAERLFPVLARSDHVPFWLQQIPALMWTDTAEFRNPNYHQPTDTPDTLNYTFLKQVTQLLVARLAT